MMNNEMVGIECHAAKNVSLCEFTNIKMVTHLLIVIQ